MSLIELIQSVAREEGKIYGVVVGIVRDIKDPLNLGRVKVDFPWLGEAREAVSINSGDDRAHSYWARIANLMGGSGRGSYFIPEVEDEVLVAFEHGDVDRPFVIGTLWNADDPPPEEMDSGGQNNLRTICSRSGHKIILNDSEDKPSISIVDKTGENSIVIDSAANAMSIAVKGDLSIEVENNITIEAKGKIEIKAGQDLAASTQANLEAKASGNGTIESTGPLELKSSAQLTADGTGKTEVKGATVSVNGSALTEVKGGLVKIN